MTMLRRLAPLRPVARAAVTSCVVMSAGDVICQAVQRRGHPGQRHDWARTGRFSLLGLTLHGPYFYFGFRALDSTFGTASNLRLALLKTAVGQVTLFPVYLAAFFVAMGALEGGSAAAARERLEAAFAAGYASGTMFWPAANVLNFLYVPPTQRVLYVNVVGLAWNAILSWINSREDLKGSR